MMKSIINKGTHRNYFSIPIGSTVAVQCEDGGSWTHGTIEGKGNHNHHQRSYNIHITKRDHMKQEAHQTNTHNSRLVSPESVAKTHNKRHTRHPQPV